MRVFENEIQWSILKSMKDEVTGFRKLHMWMKCEVLTVVTEDYSLLGCTPILRVPSKWKQYVPQKQQ